MLEKEFEKLYYKFRSNYCKNLFAQVNDGEGSLSAIESYCAEVIFLLDHPTVREFAEYVNISLPNATYRISNLIEKGFIRKIPSTKDRREYHLEVTDKFLDSYGVNATFNNRLMQQIKQRFSSEEVALLEDMMRKIVDEIMI